MIENNFYWIKKLSFQKILLSKLKSLTSEYCTKETEEMIIDKLVKEINRRDLVKEDRLN
tara:strand:+ start:544 stop:720 length:177 start_codon:yes stop_codon:yes gene_type:complete